MLGPRFLWELCPKCILYACSKPWTLYCRWPLPFSDACSESLSSISPKPLPRPDRALHTGQRILILGAGPMPKRNNSPFPYALSPRLLGVTNTCTDDPRPWALDCSPEIENLNPQSLKMQNKSLFLNRLSIAL